MCRSHWTSSLFYMYLFSTPAFFSACFRAVWQLRRGDASVNVYCMRRRCDWRGINTQHLDPNPTSAALREVDGARPRTGEPLRGEGQEERGKTKCEEGIRKVGNGELELAKNPADANLSEMR